MSTGAIILAANISSDIESFVIPTEKNDTSFARMITTNFFECEVTNVLVVTGYRSEDVKKTLKHLGVSFITLDDFNEASIVDEIKAGITTLRMQCDKIFVCPTETAFFSSETINILMNCDGDIVIPTYEGKKGFPIVINSQIYSKILMYDERSSFADILNNPRITQVLQSVNDPGILYDRQSGNDIQEISSEHSEKPLHPIVSLKIAKNSAFFGAGTATLLRQIDYCGSVKEACAKTSFSYSKGWSLIHSAETALNCKLVERIAGGKNGGESHLTDTGKQLLALFDEFGVKAKAAVSDVFNEVFEDFQAKL